VVDYIYTRMQVQQLVDSKLNQVDIKTLYLITGEQDFWLRGRKRELKRFLKGKANSIKSSLDSWLGLNSTGVELGYANYRVIEQSGRIIAFAAIETRHRHGPPIKAYAVEGAGTLATGTLDSQFKSLFSSNEASGTEALASPFSIPSALYGTRIERHYGPSNVFGIARSTRFSRQYKNQFPTSDYMRQAVILGIAVTVDLSNTFTGRTLSTIGIEPVIRDLRIKTPRADF
ncbi:MAG: hypothetical protein D6719_12205, partial [Candidatus Dadabacteria bacterium]